MGNIHMVTHKARWLGQEIRNVFYYEEQVGAPSTAEWQDIADEIRADFDAEMDAWTTDQYTLYGINHRRVDLAGLLSFDEVFTAGVISGNITTECVSTQVAALVSVKGTTTKPNRARTYLGGAPQAALVDSEWIASYQTAYATFVDLQSVLNAAGTNELQRVAAQWNSGHTAVIVTNNIAGSAGVTSPVPATQRRRRIGVGI